MTRELKMLIRKQTHWPAHGPLLALCIALAACGGANETDPSAGTPSAASEKQQGATAAKLVRTALSTTTLQRSTDTATSSATLSPVSNRTEAQLIPVVSSATAPQFGTEPKAPPGRSKVVEPQDDVTVADQESLAWSSPQTWGGTLPPAGAEVVIPAGKTILLDVSPPHLAGLRIEGTLRFARRDLALSAGFIDLTGALEIGTAASPFTQKATITLTGDIPAKNDGRSRGLNVRGGRVALYGAVPQPVWTKLGDHAQAGATALTMKEAVNWQPGDTLAVAPTDYFGIAATERLTMASANGPTVAVSTPLAKFRWGKLQYVTSSGMSLAPQAGYTPPATPAPTELDERAAVGNLTRNIVIQGADDAAWRNQGFGAHVMVMGLASKVAIDGVEFRRSGQAGVTGRYPIHWHMLSYASDGNLLGDATGHVLRNSSVWNSANRCVVIHGTNGVQVLNNICQDIKGHAFFLEDAVERRNVFEGNLALTMRSPAADKLLQVHEGTTTDGGPSGFWLTNPDNTARNNFSGDASGVGFWLAYPRTPLGLSAIVRMMPDRLRHAPFEYNTAHSNARSGVMLKFSPVDGAGNVGINRYAPTTDGSEDVYTNRVRFTLKRITSYKNRDGAYRNFASTPDYVEWVTADNVGTHFAGSVQQGTLARGLMVSASLNNASGYPVQWPFEPPTAFASYHSALAIQDNTAVGFEYVDGKPSGAFKTDDLYLIPVEMGAARNRNNRMVNSHAGYRTLPPNMDGQPYDTRNFTLAGALLDGDGYWGPKGNFWVYDHPFLTSGGNCQSVAPAGKNGQSCGGQYFGINGFETDFSPNGLAFYAAMQAVRQDANGSEIGRWVVGDGSKDVTKGIFRHFAARAGGRFVLRFPNDPSPKSIAFNVSNAYRDADSFLIGIGFDGNVTATGYTYAGVSGNRLHPKTKPTETTYVKYTRFFKPAANLAEVAAGAGDLMWQDRANHLVWIRHRGGMGYPFEYETHITAGSDEDLIRNYSVVLYPKP
jgi:hypothetical protein